MNAAQPTKRKKLTQNRRVKVRAEQGYVMSRRKANMACLRQRAMLTLFGLCVGFSFIGFELGKVALVPAHEPRVSIRSLPKIAVTRGSIYDSNGNLLATTLKVPSIYIEPQRILNPTKTVNQIAKIIKGLNKRKLLKQINNPRRRFVWVKRQITPAQAFNVNSLGLPGVAFRNEEVRVYPNKNMASHVLGAMNLDGKGVAGIEAAFNKRLVQGEDVTLTIDIRIQQQLEKSVAESMHKTKGKAAWGVVLDAKTGAVKAMASVPNFNPNKFKNARRGAEFNPITLGRYEMGSTFKLFTLAQGLDEGVITPESQIDCRYPLKIGKYKIRDFHAKRKMLTATEVMRYSSNIGAAKIADKFGAKKQQVFFYKSGLLDTPDIGLPAVAKAQYPHNWGRITTLTASFGHGVAVTPIQLVAAVAAVSTDGMYRQPFLVKGMEIENPRRVISTQTAMQVRDLMRDVVQNGSGRNTKIAGLDVGGKTGTAEKSKAGGYSENKNLVSFVGALPMHNPKLVILMMVDEPSKKYNTGGKAVAPYFKKFIQRTAPILAMIPHNGDGNETIRTAKASFR